MACLYTHNASQVLLFCTMTSVLDLIEDLLHWRGLSDGALRLDGSTSAGERGDLIARFNDKGESCVCMCVCDMDVWHRRHASIKPIYDTGVDQAYDAEPAIQWTAYRV